MGNNCIGLRFPPDVFADGPNDGLGPHFRKLEASEGKVKEKWGQPTDDDLNMIDGRREQLEGKIQQRYGVTTGLRRKVGDAPERGHKTRPRRRAGASCLGGCEETRRREVVEKGSAACCWASAPKGLAVWILRQ